MTIYGPQPSRICKDAKDHTLASTQSRKCVEIVMGGKDISFAMEMAVSNSSFPLGHSVTLRCFHRKPIWLCPKCLMRR